MRGLCDAYAYSVCKVRLHLTRRKHIFHLSGLGFEDESDKLVVACTEAHKGSQEGRFTPRSWLLDLLGYN